MTYHHEQTFELANCVHCETYIINPIIGECPSCGAETYPISKVCQPGTYVRAAGLVSDAEWRKPDGTRVFQSSASSERK